MPRNDLRFDVARKSIEAAFLPLPCAVHVHTARDDVTFRICNADGLTLFRSGTMHPHNLCNSTYLQRIIRAARWQLEREGVKLDAWGGLGANPH